MPSLISSQVFSPTSLMNIRECRCGSVPKAKVYGLRSPSAQMARSTPVVWLKNGLSVGMEPSGLIRRILPLRLLSDCELALTLLSPTPTYSLPSGPKWMAAAVVAGVGAQGVDVEQVDLAAGNRGIAIGGEPAHPVVGRRAGNRVIDVDILIRREIRVDRDAQQAALVV